MKSNSKRNIGTVLYPIGYFTSNIPNNHEKDKSVTLIHKKSRFSSSSQQVRKGIIFHLEAKASFWKQTEQILLQ